MTLNSFDDFDHYCQHFMDPAFWTPHVTDVCARHGLPAESIRPGLAGTYPTFIVAERWVVKFFGRLFDGEQAHAVEQAAAHLLRGWQALPVAQIQAEGRLRDEVDGWPWPYLIYNFLPGVSIGEVYNKLLPEEKLRLARDMGRVVRELHDLPLPAEGPLRCDWAPFRDFLGRQHATCAARLAEWKALPPHLLAQVEDFLPPLAELIDECVPPRFLHGDLTRDHLLGQVREGRWITSGWIDFGDARAGDPFYEWVALHLDLFGGDRELLNTFLDVYGLPAIQRKGFARRAMAYTLLFPFNVTGMHMERHPELAGCAALDELAEKIWEV